MLYTSPQRAELISALQVSNPPSQFLPGSHRMSNKLSTRKTHPIAEPVPGTNGIKHSES